MVQVFSGFVRMVRGSKILAKGSREGTEPRRVPEIMVCDSHSRLHFLAEIGNLLCTRPSQELVYLFLKH